MRRSAAVFFLLAMFSVVPLAAGDLVDRRAEPPNQGPEECGGDRVAGVWRARNLLHGWTYITTLHIQRVPGDAGALRGRMVVTAFSGRGRAPPPCQPGQQAYRVTQPAEGRIDGLRLDFRALSANIDRQICGSGYGYNPDRFTGTIDARAPVFRSVNNDGDGAVNAPVMFRRVRCR